MSIIKRAGRAAVPLVVVAALALSVLGLGLSPGGSRLPGQPVPVEFPKTPAGEQARSLVDILNGAIPLAPKEFVRQNCSEEFKSRVPEAAWGGIIQQVKTMAAPVEVVSIDRSEPHEISFTIRSQDRGLAFAIDVAVAARPPHPIRSMSFTPAGPGAGTPVPDPSAERRPAAVTVDLDRVKAYLADQARLGQFSGAALIAKDGKPLLLESAGMASKRFRAPNRIDTKFNLGSLNKGFTAVAVLQLVETGLVGIDDPIGKYLDVFPKDIAEKVKVRHLLTMGSGWGDYWGHPYYLQHKDELRTVPQYMEFIKGIPLDFEPGTRTQHSNIGFEVAGALIEKVSGMDYFSYIRERIYKPAGMTSTDTYDRDSGIENLAVGYTNAHPLNENATDYRWENTYILSPRGTPAGGGYSTVEDMLMYDTAVRSGKLIGKKYVDFLRNGYQGNIGDPFVPRRVLRGAGGASGVSSFYARDVRNGYAIIILTNVDHPAAIEIGNEVIKIMGLE
jgi:CubicO group peptidase (beta-lactamase class C family)